MHSKTRGPLIKDITLIRYNLCCWNKWSCSVLMLHSLIPVWTQTTQVRGAKRNLCFVSHNCGRILISNFLHHILTRHFPIILSFVWPVSHSNNTQSLCFPKEILTSTVIYHYAVPYHFLSTNHIGSSTLSWTEYSRSPLRYFEDK